MTSAISKITEKLNEVFSSMDAKVLESSKAWARGRVAAIKEFRSSEDYKKMGQFERYETMFSIAGGKTWYNSFHGRTTEQIDEVVTKNCGVTAEKRNNSIAKKLEKIGVKEVVSEEFTMTSDGFNGVFIVETDKGRKKITIETIMAGGYNVQALHLRVLVNVK